MTEPRRSQQFPGALNLTFEGIGSIDYTKGGMMRPAELLWISTMARGRGLSKLLVQTFIEQVGRGKNVETSDVTHLDSWLALERIGFLEEAFNSKKVVRLEGTRLYQIPIAYILQSGGLNVEKLEILYHRTGLKYENIRDEILESPDSGPSFFHTKIFAAT